jgi:MFS family permease
MTNTALLDSRAAWITASAALAILTLCYGAPLVSVVAMKPIAAELGTSRSGPAGAGSMVYIGAAFGGIVAGWLAGKLGVRRIVIFGGTMVGAGLILSASGGMLELYAGHGLLMGLFGTACMFSPLITYVSRWFERRRGAAVALISSGQAVAGAIWPPILQLGVDAVGWRWTMVAFAVLTAVAVLALTLVFLHPPPEESAAALGASDRPQATGDVLGMPRNRLMILLMAAVFCCCVPMAVPMHHVPAFCSDLGMTPQYGAAMLSVLLGFAFLARQFWGWVADRIGGLQTLLWSSLVQATGLAGFLLTKDQAALFAISAVFGIGLSGLLPAYVITVREYYPVEEANWRIPTVLFAGLLGMATGGWGAGFLYDEFAGYLPAFAVGMAFNLANLAVLLFLVSRTHTRLMRQPQTST